MVIITSLWHTQVSLVTPMHKLSNRIPSCTGSNSMSDCGLVCRPLSLSSVRAGTDKEEGLRNIANREKLEQSLAELRACWVDRYGLMVFFSELEMSQASAESFLLLLQGHLQFEWPVLWGKQ